MSVVDMLRERDDVLRELQFRLCRYTLNFGCAASRGGLPAGHGECTEEDQVEAPQEKSLGEVVDQIKLV